jgi:hypothetical protein
MKNMVLTWILLAFLGCAEESGEAPVAGPLQGNLALEIRDQAELKIEGQGQKRRISIQCSKGFGFAPEGQMLSAEGLAEAFPEAKMTLFTARFEPVSLPGSRCGAEPVSLALSLHKRDEAARVSGSLAVYCGAGVYSGEPIRILRISGELHSD